MLELLVHLLVTAVFSVWVCVSILVSVTRGEPLNEHEVRQGLKEIGMELD